MYNIAKKYISTVNGLGDFLDTATGITELVNSLAQSTATVISATKGNNSGSNTTMVGGNTSTYSPTTTPTVLYVPQSNTQTSTEKKTDYTPWLIGGGIALLGLMAVMVINSNNKRR